jgi:Allene oxide cyclase barrel like domain
MIRTALIAAGLVSAAIAAPGLAQTTPTSVHLVATQGHGGFQPGRPKPGSRFGFVQSISGDDHGTSRGVCTYLGGKPLLLCTLELDLAKGTITAQGLIPQRSHDTPVAITGGTGAYNGARGTALATDVSSSKTTIDISLLG